MWKFLIVLLCVLLSPSSVGSHNYEDNDFAEFEVFEEEEEELPLGDNSKPSVVHSKVKEVLDESPLTSEEHIGSEEEEDEEEEEEAVVEDELDPDEFSHFADEDEFTGYDTGRRSSSKSGQNQKEEPKITIAKVPLHLRSNWDSFYLEMMMIAGLIVYFANFVIGKNKNHKIANTWLASHKTLLQQNFTLIGDDGKKGDLVEGTGLLKESENVYTLWCSGRMCIEGMLVELKFIKRQDLIAVMTQLVRPSSDQLIFKVFLDDMDSFVFSLATKKTAARLAKDMTDISTYCPERKLADRYGIGSQFLLMNEIGEVASVILGDPKVLAVINKYPGKVEFFHFSDQYSGVKQQEDSQPIKLPEVQKILIFGFNFPGKGYPTQEDIESMRVLFQLVLHLTDKLRKFKLSKEGRQRADKNRARVEEAFMKATHAARAEMAQSMKEKKKRAERERMLEIDDPEKQRKWEEREQRRLAKRRTPKMKQLKVKAM